MGKQKRVRHKYHLPAINSKESANNQSTKNVTENISQEWILDPSGISENVFAGINININNLKKDLNFDTKSFKSLKSELAADKPVSKKEKIALRHEFLLKKIDAVRQARKKYKEKKNRQKTVITGDMEPLLEALPSLESLLQPKDQILTKKIKPKKKAIASTHKRRKNMMKQIKLHKMLLKSPDFDKSALEFLTENIGSAASGNSKN